MTDENEVRELYRDLISAWNRRDAQDMASLFAEAGSVVGFDGSQVDGRDAIEAHLTPIFAGHPTPLFVPIVRSVRFVGPRVAVLRAVAGMAKNDINPDLNAVQTVVAAKTQARWQVEVFQNTPAAFHGRPDDAAKLTEELRAALRAAPPIR